MNLGSEWPAVRLQHLKFLSALVSKKNSFGDASARTSDLSPFEGNGIKMVTLQVP